MKIAIAGYGVEGQASYRYYASDENNTITIVDQSYPSVDMPKNVKTNQMNSDLCQEKKDANKLGIWKKALKGKGLGKCSIDVKEYLDKELPGWRNTLDEKQLLSAKELVDRAKQRDEIGLRLLPRSLEKIQRTTSELIQENKDYEKLSGWKKQIKKNYNVNYTVKEYLDEHNGESDPRKYFGPAKESMKRVAIEKILMCGSNGKA